MTIKKIFILKEFMEPDMTYRCIYLSLTDYFRDMTEVCVTLDEALESFLEEKYLSGNLTLSGVRQVKNDRAKNRSKLQRMTWI